MTVVIAAPSGDEALKVTRWIAARTQERLESAGVSVLPLFDSAATRRDLESSLAHARGVVSCSHANELSVRGRGEPLLDADNIGCVSGRWVHAIGCRSAGAAAAGSPLWLLALDTGAVCWIGYTARLVVEWDPAELSGGLENLMAELTTTVTLLVARGILDPLALKRAVQLVADRVLAWCDEDPVPHPGIEITAQQFVTNLRVCLPDRGVDRL